jgi:type II secretory pathway pseudopilin PulG
MRRVRRALTLMELAVLLAVVAILAALMMPFVSKVRHTAAHTKCVNNLHAIGLTIHTYHDSHFQFPPGTAQGTHLPPDQRLSFQILILPSVESGTSSLRFKPLQPWDSPANATFNVPVPLFQCPDWTAWPTGPAPRTGHDTHTNYIGIAGFGADAATLPDDHPRAGIFGYDRALQIEQVKDGLANTLLLIETGRDVGPWLRGGPATVRGVDPSDSPPVGDGRPFGGTHFADNSFSSKVPRGGNVMMADASVRKLSDGIDADVLGRLATVAGGEDVPADW